MTIGSLAFEIFVDTQVRRLMGECGPNDPITIVGFAKIVGTNIIVGGNIDDPSIPFYVVVHIRRKFKNLVLLVTKGAYYRTDEKIRGLIPFKARELRKPIKKAIARWLDGSLKGESWCRPIL